MKAFICAILILITTTSLIYANSVFTEYYSKEMIRIADSLPKESIEGAQEVLTHLSEYFSSKEPLIMSTNNHTKVHEMRKTLSQMQAAILSGDFQSYTQARLALYDAVRILEEFNKISFGEIF